MPDSIEKLRELRQSSRSAVIVATENRHGDRPVIAHPVESWLERYLLDQLRSSWSALRLLILAGNAGDGKSFLLQSLRNKLERDGNVDPEAIEWVLDASHSNERTQQSSERLAEFFRPFSNEADWNPAKVHVIAINTGAIVHFLEDAAEFSDLKTILYAQLGVERPAEDDLGRCAEKFDGVLTVDLDRRLLFPPQHEVSPFLESMLNEIRPDRPWLSSASIACTSCSVSAHCPVNVNLAALQLPQVQRKLSTMLSDVALEDRIHIGPRSLWHLLYLMTVGGLDRFATRNGINLPTCETMASLSDEHRAAGLFYTALFEEAEAHESLFEFLAELRRVDPRDSFDIEAFRLALAASQSSEEDVRLAAPAAAAVGVAPDTLAAYGSGTVRVAAYMRRKFFLDPSNAPTEREAALNEFRCLLIAYREAVLNGSGFRDRPLEETLIKALDEMHGTRRANGYWHVGLPWPAVADVLVEVALRSRPEHVKEVRILGPDTWRQSGSRPESLALGAALDAYPLAVNVRLRPASRDGDGTRVRVTWSLFRVLKKVGAGYLAGSLDPERVQHLERIAAAITADAATKALVVANEEGQWVCEKTDNAGEYDVFPLR